MSTAASPRKPWESTAAVPPSSSGPPPPSSAAFPSSSVPSSSSSDLNDSFALVAANNRPSTSAPSPGTSTSGPSTSSPSSTALSPSPYDPNHPQYPGSPYPQGLNGLNGLNPSLYPGSGLLSHNGLYPQPGLPLPYSPVAHIGSSIQSFGRFSQLLQLNFDALHMSFSSLLRLFDSWSMLRNETVMLGQTFTTLNVFAWLGRRVWRVLEWLTGRREAGELERGWKAAAGVAGVDAAKGSAAAAAAAAASPPSFFSGWTWTFLLIALGWSALRWLVRAVRRRLFKEPTDAFAPPLTPSVQAAAPGAVNPADPNQPHPNSAALPNGVAHPIASPPYPSPYASMGYSAGAGYGSPGYGGYGMGGGLSSYGGMSSYGGLGGYSGGAYGSAYGSAYGTGGYGAGYGGLGAGGMYTGAAGYGVGGLGY